MNIQMIGIDHSLASVDERALFSFTRSRAQVAMIALCEEPDIHGCVILSTCNRMEVWIHAEGEEPVPLMEMICCYLGHDPAEYGHCFVTRQGEEAVRHLFRMTSGLKSLILGEDQILSQVKDALQLSRDVYCADSVLETLFRMAVTGAKKVKGGMQRSMTNLSAIEQAISWLKKERGTDFRNTRCLVIGNGEMGKRSALALREERAHVTVTVRQYRSGHVEIPVGCDRINYGDRYELLPDCDYVVSATSSPNLTLTAEAVSGFDLTREQVFLDLAVPRDIDPEIGRLPGKTLYTIDDFSVTESEENAQAVRLAEELLEEQIAEFRNWYEGRDLIPRVEKIGEDLAGEIWWRSGRTVKRLSLEQAQEQELKEAVVTAADKVIRKLLFDIRNEAGMDTLRRVLDALKGEDD